MAIARTSPVFSSISGGIGGVIANNTRNGLVISRRRCRKPATTQYNRPAQNTIAAITKAWQNLSDDDKLAWDRAGLRFSSANRLGQSNPLSGYRLYHTFFGAQFDIYGVRDLPPPPPYRQPPFIYLGLSFTFGGTYVVSGYGAYSVSTDQVQISVARSFSDRRRKHYRNWQRAKTVLYSQLPLDISYNMDYHFGESFYDGEWIGVRVRTFQSLTMPSVWLYGDTQVS